MKQNLQGYWPLAEAKNRLSEVTQLALEKPQKIYRRAGNIVLIAEKEYLRLMGNTPDFKSFLLNQTPAHLNELDLSRDKSSMREIDL